jgi:putative PIN family toxin of toxin-antitoxin system
VFSQGRLAPLRAAWQTQRIQPLISRVTAAELIRVLAYPKFKLNPAEQMELIADYLPYCTTITIPDPPPLTPEYRDVFDVPFLQLSMAGEAEALITGDQDLLVLAMAGDTPIMTADQFLLTVVPAE